jgi:hypothetical protein
VRLVGLLLMGAGGLILYSVLNGRDPARDWQETAHFFTHSHEPAPSWLSNPLGTGH